MHAKTLYILVATTLTLIALAVFVGRERESQITDQTAQVLFPDLAASLESVSQIEVTSGTNVTTLAREKEGWVVRNKDNYAADPLKLREVLLALTSLRTSEAKTRKPENYAKLGVADSGTGGAAHQILVKNDKGMLLAGLIAGKTQPGHGANSEPQLFVRKTGDAQVWLASGKLDLPNDAMAWLDRSVGDIKGTRVKAAKVVPATGAPIAIVREKQGEATLVAKDLPKGVELQNTNSLYSIAGALENLQFDDVMPVGQVDFSKAKVALAKLETYEGVTVTATLMDQAGKVYAKFAATAEETPVAAAAPAEKLSDKSAPAKPTANPTLEAQALNARWEKWVFVLPTYKATALMQGLETYKKN